MFNCTLNNLFYKRYIFGMFCHIELNSEMEILKIKFRSCTGILYYCTN